MSIATSKLEYEKQFAASIGVDRYATWDEYATDRRLGVQFKPEQIAAIERTFEHWREMDRLLMAVFRVPDTTGESN